MDPIESISPEKDTTLGIIYAAQKRGWKLQYIDYTSLSLLGDKVQATVQSLTVFLDKDHWFDLGERQTLSLDTQNAILMRKDPPVDSEFLYACRVLEFVPGSVFNNPSGILLSNEKILSHEFPEFSVPTLVSRDLKFLEQFLTQHKDVVVKPLNEMGGRSVFRIKCDDPEAMNITGAMCQQGKRSIVMQKLIPEYVEGDKRVLLIDGDFVPFALNRIPKPGELRANLAAGGRGEVVELADRDRTICRSIAPRIKELGLLFVGIDIIGGKLTEINVTSPTCAREITQHSGYDVCDALMQSIEGQLK